MSKKRYIICFEFLGDNFFGSQKQPDKRTVQGELEEKLSTLTKEQISIIPSGRVDRGVSAKYQTAHFDCDEIADIDKFKYSLNCVLPDDLKVFELREIKPDFHAQKDAKYKHYRYTIQNNPVASVFLKRNLFYPYFELDIDKINEILSYIVGYHDFSSFKSASDNPYDDCTIYYAKAKKVKIERCDFIYIDIVGDRFLYNMIRTIVGEILYILRNNKPSEYMKEVLEAKNRADAANVIEAKGLTLEYVGYDDVQNYIKQHLNS